MGLEGGGPPSFVSTLPLPLPLVPFSIGDNGVADGFGDPAAEANLDATTTLLFLELVQDPI